MDTPGWIRTITEQRGIVTREQALAAGLTPGQVRGRVRHGRWTALFRGVYATHVGPLTREAELHAALLAAGDDAALSHATAAEIWRLDPFAERDPEAPIHVTRTRAASVRGRENSERIPSAPIEGVLVPGHEGLHPGYVVHRSRALAHIVVDAGFPVTSKVATIVDLAISRPDARSAYGWLLRTAASTRTGWETLASHLEHRRPRRYSAALKAAVEMMRSGVGSALEAEFILRVEVPFGLPASARQVPVVVDGRTLFEDIVYEAGGAVLVVRLDGRRWHSDPGTRFRDMRRDNAAEVRGDHRLVFGWEDVVERPREVADQIKAVLARMTG